MNKLAILNKNYQFNFSNEIVNFFDPKNIYVPFKDELLIDNNNNIQINIDETLFDETEYYYSSTISGTISGTLYMENNGKKIRCLNIVNDYTEKRVKGRKKVREFSKISIEQLDQILSQRFIAQYKDRLFNNSNIIVINGISNESYIFNETLYLDNHYEEIFELIDYLSQIFNIHDILLVLKETDGKNINTFITNLGSYINIKLILVNDEYLLSNNYFLAKKLKISPSNALMLKPSELYELYKSIRFNKTLDTKYITICNENGYSYFVNTKLYVSVKELFDKLDIKINDDKIVIKNGLMNGTVINIQSEIVSKDTEAYFIMNRKNNIETECINCGKCYEICPLNIDPKYSMDNKKINKNCIDCGLCTYICPSFINLRKYLKGDKK